MSSSAQSPPPGWYVDPAGSGGERYWDGGTWSQVTRPAGGMAAGGAQQQGQPTPYARYAPGGHSPAMVRQPMLAGFWWRVLASILDNLILLFPLGVMQQVVAGDALDALSLWLADWSIAVSEGAVAPPLPEGILSTIYLSVFASMVFLIIYRTVLVALQGGTLGQLITGLRVVPDGGSLETRPSWGTSFVRALTAVVFSQVPILNLVDPLSMLFSTKKQTLHDRIARTVVLKK